MNHFLINEPIGFPIEAISELKKNGLVYLANGGYPEQKITVAFIRLAQNIGREFHLKHPKLKWIVTPTTGLNHIDFNYFEQNKIKIISLFGQTEFLRRHAAAPAI